MLVKVVIKSGYFSVCCLLEEYGVVVLSCKSSWSNLFILSNDMKFINIIGGVMLGVIVNGS